MWSKVFITVLFAALTTIHESNHQVNHLHKRNKHIYIPGDIILGGQFSVHIRNHSSAMHDGLECEGTFSRASFQEVEAMLQAVDEVNSNHTLLPGVQIGVDIKDTCGSVDFAIKGLLNFSFVRKYFREPASCPRQERKPSLKAKQSSIEETMEPETVAIIGPDLSDIARAVTDLAGLFHVPVVSHSASSPLLGDKTRFKYFFRTVPSDTFQARLIADLLVEFRWTYVILLHSDDEYGRSGRNALQRRLLSLNICTAIDEKLTFRAGKIQNIVQSIKMEKKAKVIILFSSLRYAMELIKESKRKKLHGFTWIATDAWAGSHLVMRDNYKVLEGMLGITPKPYLMPSFKNSLRELATNGSKQDVWAREFANFEKSMCQDKKIDVCMRSESYELSPYIGTTRNAVLLVAHALHEALGCKTTSCSRTLKDLDLSSLTEHLKNKYHSLDWYESFYQISNLKPTGGRRTYEFLSVGEWRFDENGSLNGTQWLHFTNSIYWNTGKEIPKSFCSKDCIVGYRKRPKKGHPRCCWSCIKCGANSISNKTNMDMCIACPSDHWRSQDRSKCYKVTDRYLNWKDNWIKAVVIVSSIGILLVLMTIVVFIWFRNTAVVRASSRQMSYVLLVGVIMFYALPFTMLGKPSKFMCEAMPFTLGLTLALNVGTMLVKTNRIARIFSRKLMKAGRVRFLATEWQYIMIVCIILTEIMTCLLWVLAFDSPQIELQQDIGGKYRVITCSYTKGTQGLVMWGTFNFGLILVCTYQAYLVRKVPSNYNEAKFIAFTMITLCMTIFVYVPVYVGTISYTRDIICCFLYIFAGTIEFTCIFGPKLHVILLRPQKNVPIAIATDDFGRYNSRKITFEHSSCSEKEFSVKGRKIDMNIKQDDNSLARRMSPVSEESYSMLQQTSGQSNASYRENNTNMNRVSHDKRASKIVQDSFDANAPSQTNDIVLNATASNGAKLQHFIKTEGDESASMVRNTHTASTSSRHKRFRSKSKSSKENKRDSVTKCYDGIFVLKNSIISPSTSNSKDSLLQTSPEMNKRSAGSSVTSSKLDSALGVSSSCEEFGTANTAVRKAGLKGCESRNDLNTNSISLDIVENLNENRKELHRRMSTFLSLRNLNDELVSNGYLQVECHREHFYSLEKGQTKR